MVLNLEKKEENTRKSFIFYESFYNAIVELDDKKRLKMYDAITKFALKNEKEEDLKGICKQLFILIEPQISANNKRFEDGQKGGRPKKNKTSGLENKKPNNNENENENVNVNENENVNVNDNENEFNLQKQKNILITEDEIKNFIEDFKIFKNKNFEPTAAERKNIVIVLSELGGYDAEYWRKVFTLAKGGYLINGQIVPCNLRKILLEHNSIFAGEANLAPNKEHIEEIKQINKAKKSKKENEYKNIAEEERQKREKAFSNINSSESAVKYLNEYVVGGRLAKSIASDFKELSKIYDIGLSAEGVFYDKAC